jgi:hypothetical protein
LQEYVILNEAKDLGLLPEIMFENEILSGTEPQGGVVAALLRTT